MSSFLEVLKSFLPFFLSKGVVQRPKVADLFCSHWYFEYTIQWNNQVQFELLHFSGLTDIDDYEWKEIFSSQSLEL